MKKNYYFLLSIIKVLSAISLILCWQYVAAQERAPLKFNSYAYKLHVPKDESLFIVTRAGEVARSENIDSAWKFVSLKASENLVLGTILDNANFFNKDTGFVSGFISNNNEYNIIYHTTNGGKTWSKIDFGQDGWVDDAINFDNGEAWISVAGSGLAHTSDYGFHWKLVSIPDKKQRYSKIWFRPNGEGIIGSLYNSLLSTSDNGKTWNTLKTPLDQGKYKKTSWENRPEFNRVLIYKNYFLVKQEELCFYSKKDEINWMTLKGIVDFFTDENNSALYFEDKHGVFFLMGDSLKVTKELGLFTPRNSVKCTNGKLFVFQGDKIAKLSTVDSAHVSKVGTNDFDSKKPSTFAFTKNGIYGNIGGKIYLSKSDSEKWRHLFDLPFEFDETKIALSAISDTAIFCQFVNDSLAYFNTQTRHIHYATKSTLFSEFAKSKIQSVILEAGSRGCFHNFANKISYKRDGDIFELVDVETKEKKISLNEIADNINTFDVVIVDSFLYNINSWRNRQVDFAELGFKNDDFKKCRKDILDFREHVEKQKKGNTNFFITENNIDFGKLESLVDSVEKIDSQTLSYMLQNPEDMWSTTSNWKAVRFINENGQELSITNYFYENSPLNLPWVVSIDGIKILIVNTTVNKFLEKTFPGFLKTDKKANMLNKFVRELYRSLN